MSSVVTDARRPFGESLQYFFWVHPEWWSKAISSLAWIVMLLHAAQPGGHEMHQRASFAIELWSWILMVTAMMLPLVTGRVWVTAAGSLWRRRHRAIAGFLGGYLGVWLVPGLFVAALRLQPLSHSAIVPALGFVVAAVWLMTPMHRKGVSSCHRTVPLAPVGWRADRDCVHFGGVIGTACIQSCWPLMFACAFAGHSLVAMAGGMAVGVMERGLFRTRRRWVLTATWMLAAYYVALAVRA